MDYLAILKNSYEIERNNSGLVSKTIHEYLAESIFGFTTGDGGMACLFVKRAAEVCNVISDGTTFYYIEDEENYRLFLMMCNTVFFSDKIEWGTSIRGAWWKNKISFQSCGLYVGFEQLSEQIEFTKLEWIRFMKAVSDLAKQADEP